ncbi:MAG TPA: methionyl-tRNA formyltransferase [Dehalococcoidia bacterium]
MRIIFMGSPAFAVPTIRALADSRHNLVAVVTQPDKPAGRGRHPTPPPAKVFADARAITVLQPVNVSSPPSVERLRALEPDVIVVAAYGQILRERVLDLPKRGSLNVHASLLPRHRGASPVAAAILAGDAVTGVTIMEVVRALDAGPMVAKVETPIGPHDTTGSLEAKLSEAGASLLLEVLDPWAQRRLRPEPQDDEASSYAPMVRRADALIDWSLPAVEIWRRVRAFNPWPVAFTRFASEELRVLEALPVDDVRDGDVPGTVVGSVEAPPESGAHGKVPLVQTGSGKLALLSLQRQGRRALAGADFLRGQRDFQGSRLG